MKLKTKSSLLLVGLSYLSFVNLGLPDGLNGVAWPSIRAYFDLPLDALGALLVMFTLGYLASSMTSGWLLARMSVGTLLALSCLATSISLIGYTFVPMWWMMVALGAIAGLGAGAIDAGLNTFAATEFSARMVNWLHACNGIGAATGPVIMTSVLAAGRPWQRGYQVVGLWQLLLAICFILTRKWWPKQNATEQTSPSANPRAASSLSTLRLPVVWLSVAVFFVYTGVEAAAGTWAYTLFTESRAVSMTTAGMWVSIYWGSLTVGRLLSGIIVAFVPVRLLLRYSIITIAIGAALLWLNITSLLSFLGLSLMGLASAPVFPSLIAATPVRIGEAHTGNAIGFQISAAVLGQSLLPGLVGVLANRVGLEIVGPVLLTASLLLLALYEAMTAMSAKMDVIAQNTA
ncbi:MAG TPA: MFS transporter [Blastocatellia bacterium]|nr:MFS transporter [Blastocatellia bacterium]